MAGNSLIFDIGKTNKKCFVLDGDYQIIEKSEERFNTIQDEDGHSCEDIALLTDWVRDRVHHYVSDESYDIARINFSTYGASLVHLDQDGQVIAPLYDYMKSVDEQVWKAFYSDYGGETEISRSTASPPSGMLNSGLQLYWLKHKRPELWDKIHTSLHLPQYFCFLFARKRVSDFTSVGCHTGMWNYDREDYHAWLEDSGCGDKLAPLVPTSTHYTMELHGRSCQIGVGIHDSSASLLPYIRSESKSFLLVSTGTWSISLLPHTDAPLTTEDLEHDCLHYMRPTGDPVRACRLFLGREHDHQVELLTRHFGVEDDAHKSVELDREMSAVAQMSTSAYQFQHIEHPHAVSSATDYARFTSFEQAYHQLVWELSLAQARSIRRCLAGTTVRKIYIDGGFSQNDLFIYYLAQHFPDCKIRMTHSPMGSSLGAALVMRDEQLKKSFLKTKYSLRKYKRKAKLA